MLIIIYNSYFKGFMKEKITLGRVAQKAIVDACTNMSYQIGNATDAAVSQAEHINNLGRGALTIETGRAIGSIGYKAAEDYARNDKLCTGICLVATACEVIAGTSAFIGYPGSRKVYVLTKAVSVGCVRFRDLCRNAKGDLTPC